MQKTYNFIKQNCHSTYFIATANGDQPRVRHKKDVAKQISVNPRVELCCFDGQATWLRLSGILVEDERVEAKKDATARFDSFVKEQEIEKF